MEEKLAAPNPPQSLLETNFMANMNRLSQTLYWIFLQPAVWILVRRKSAVIKSSDIKDARYIITANHQSQIDPFLLLACFPLPVFLRLLPVRFLAHNGLFKSLIKHIVLIFGGAFPTHKHPKYPFGLPGAYRFMENNHTVLIFPEGKRAQYKTVEPKPGVAKLATYPRAQLIPVQIIWKRKGLLRSCSLKIGKPTPAKGKSPAQIMDIIHDL